MVRCKELSEYADESDVETLRHDKTNLQQHQRNKTDQKTTADPKIICFACHRVFK